MTPTRKEDSPETPTLDLHKIYLLRDDPSYLDEDGPIWLVMGGPFEDSREAALHLEKDVSLKPGEYYTIRVQTKLELTEETVRTVRRRTTT